MSWDTSYLIKIIAKWVSGDCGPKFPTHAKVTRFIIPYFGYVYLPLSIYFTISCLVLLLELNVRGSESTKFNPYDTTFTKAHQDSTLTWNNKGGG